MPHRQGLGIPVGNSKALHLKSDTAEFDSSRLQLTGSQITDVGLEQLRLPALTKLNLSNCVGITDAALAKLQGMPSLESLFVGATSVTAQDLTHLATMKNLKYFIIDGQQFKGDEQSIEALKTLLPNCEAVILRG